MSILWCGGEDIDFYYTDFCPDVTTSSGQYRSANARCGLVTANGDNYLGGANTYDAYSGCDGYYSSPWGDGEQTDFWATFRCSLYNSSGTAYDSYIFFLCNAGSTTNKWGLWKKSGKLWLSKEVSGSWSDIKSGENTDCVLNGNQEKFDVYIKYDDTEGEISVYYSGELRLSYTGDTTLSGISGLDQCGFLGNYYYLHYAISEVIIADEDTRDMELVTLAPNASGESNTFSTGSYTDVDEVTLNKTDSIWADSNGEAILLNLGSLSTQRYVRAVKVNALGINGLSSFGIKTGIKTNSVIYSGETRSCDPSWEPVEALYQKNPATDSYFTSGEINSLQAYVKAVV
jgi:hypothetical protein